MKALNTVTKLIGGAALMAAMFVAAPKAHAQARVAFGVQIGGPVVVERPAYSYGYYQTYYRDDCDRDAWRRREFYEQQRREREHWEHERWEHQRDFDRDRGYDRGYDRRYDYDRR